MKEKIRFYSRYTDLPSLIHMLKSKSIFLLDPNRWDDRNDAKYIEVYLKRKELKSSAALCFTRAGVTYHHWKIFSGSPSGVCIRFKQDSLKNMVSKYTDVVLENIEYKLIEENSKKLPTVEELPFLKRKAFKPEKETRIFWATALENVKPPEIEFNISDIYAIILSPWMHKNLSNSVIDLLRSIEGCSKIKIRRSTLIENKTWLSHAADAE